jgi:hypothetical protein
VLHLGCNNFQTGLLEAAVDLADHIFGDRVRLDDGNGALERHGETPDEDWELAGGAVARDGFRPKNAGLQLIGQVV